MARIAGVDLPREKRLEIALTYIYGVGPTTAKKILARTGVSPDVRVKNLTEEDEKKLRDLIEPTSPSKAICAVKSRPTSSGWPTSAAIAACVTAAASRCAGSAPRPTRGPARVPSARLPARRKSPPRSSSTACEIVVKQRRGHGAVSFLRGGTSAALSK